MNVNEAVSGKIRGPHHCRERRVNENEEVPRLTPCNVEGRVVGLNRFAVQDRA